MKIILTTCSEKESEDIAKHLLEERLCACVSVSEVKSLYWWNEKIQSGKESLLIIKTNDDAADEAVERIKQLHSYENPEIIVLNVEKAADKYLKWIDDIAK